MRAGVLVDSALPGARVHAVPPLRPHRHYPDLESALGRFRLSPDQPCANPWIADYLARMGLKETPEHEWTWRFDRKIWGGTDVGDPWRWLREARAPLAVLRGALSPLTKGENADRMRREAPAGTIFVDIPQAYHHVMVDQPLALIAALRVLLATWLPQAA